jgi:hypothetical protein
MGARYYSDLICCFLPKRTGKDGNEAPRDGGRG